MRRGTWRQPQLQPYGGSVAVAVRCCGLFGSIIQKPLHWQGSPPPSRLWATESWSPGHRRSTEIAIFAAANSVSSGNASPAMKRDIVKPMPASAPAPAPATWRHEYAVGLAAMPRRCSVVLESYGCIAVVRDGLLSSEFHSEQRPLTYLFPSATRRSPVWASFLLSRARFASPSSRSLLELK